MPSVRVVFGKNTETPAKFYSKDKQISVNTAFGMYKNKARFVVDGNTLNLSRFGASEDIHEAIRNGNHQLVAQLIENGADLTLRDKDGNIPVTLAADGHHKIVGMLADAGANLDLGDSTGETALVGASIFADLEMVSLLVNKGATVDNIEEGDDMTPLWHAVHEGIQQSEDDFSLAHTHRKIVGVLADAGANLDIANEYGETPLFTAVERGRIDFVRILVEKGANINIRANFRRGRIKGVTPIWLAAHDLGIRNSEDEYKVRLDIVKLLTARGASFANIDVVDEEGLTPLFIAASNGQLELFRILIQNGADPFFCTSNKIYRKNKCVLDIARSARHPRSAGHKRIIDILEALENKRLALTVASLTRQNPSEVPVPEDMNREIIKFLIKN